MLKHIMAKSTFIAIACSISICTHAVADSPTAIDVPAGELITALKSLAAQADIELVYQPRQLKNLHTNGLHGNYSAHEAVTLLLKDTPLQVHTDPSGAMVIALPTAATPNEAPQASTSAPEPSKSFWSRLRLAQSETPSTSQADTPSPSQGEGQSEDEKEAQLQKRIEVEEIVVTGTHIRGAPAVGSKVTVITGEQIRQSGHGRVQDVVGFLPQNFSGSAGEVFSTDGGASNQTRGQGVDLRGLGASSTLVLINGRRLASGGIEGAFVDISSIPASAIERVEILTDGASALYGSDAVGGVVNFVMRSDYSGLETRTRFGRVGGAADEQQASVLGGTSWGSGGHLLLGYQYSRRDALLFEDTFYGRMNNDFRSLGGDNFAQAGGNPGTIFLGGVPAYEIPTGQNGVGLDVADLIPITAPTRYLDNVTGIEALPQQKHHDVFTSISRTLTPAVTVFAEGRYGRRSMEYGIAEPAGTFFIPSSNPFYPTGLPAFASVSYSFREVFGVAKQYGDTDTLGLAAGLTLDLSDRWQSTLSVSRARENNDWRWDNVRFQEVFETLSDTDPLTALNPFADGSNTHPATLAYLRNAEVGTSRSTVTAANLLLDGPLFDLPSGTVKAALGLDYRDEQLNARHGNQNLSTGVFVDEAAYVGEIGRHVKAAFGEVVVPLLQRGASESSLLTVSAAGRYEDYSDFGSTFNPKLGLQLTPRDAFTLRGSWGTSFRAPRFNELSDTARPSFATALLGPDPQSSSGFSDILIVTGAEPSLSEETADIWTAGVDFSPAAVPGLALSATYFSIDYQDKILNGGGNAGFAILLDEAQWQEIITRSPSSEQIQAICNDTRIRLIGACPQAVAAIADLRLRNLAGLRVRGFDLQADYAVQLSRSRLTFGLLGTYTAHHDLAVSSSSGYENNVNTPGFPLKLKLRGMMGLSAGAWQLNAITHYANNYEDRLLNRRVGSWATVDLVGGYTSSSSGWLNGVQLQLSLINAFDREPPFVNTRLGFDAANANQTGRSIALSVVKDWGR